MLSVECEIIEIHLAPVKEANLPPDAMQALGLRAADNIMWRRLIALNGPVAVKHARRARSLSSLG
jgi:hypothetical protein